MDKQQAAREAFEKAWQRSIDTYTGDPDANTYWCSHQEAGWLMWQATQAALMPALVEARDCAQEIIAYANAHSQRSEDGVSFHPIASTLLVKLGDTIAHLNAIIGDKK